MLGSMSRNVGHAGPFKQRNFRYYAAMSLSRLAKIETTFTRRSFSTGASHADHSQLFGGVSRDLFLKITTGIPFAKEFLHPIPGKLEKGEFSMSLPFRKEMVGNPSVPCLHGGILAAMIDHVGGFTAWSMVDSNLKRVSTVDLRVDYLNPAPCEEIHFDAVVAHKTNKLIRVDVVCWNNKRDKKIAIGRCLFNIYSVQVPLGESSKTNQGHD